MIVQCKGISSGEKSLPLLCEFHLEALPVSLAPAKNLLPIFIPISILLSKSSVFIIKSISVFFAPPDTRGSSYKFDAQIIINVLCKRVACHYQDTFMFAKAETAITASGVISSFGMSTLL